MTENDHHDIRLMLQAIDEIMPTTKSKQPKVLLFDIGGVCVVSPFKAILEYELSNNIPPGWVNYAISASKPNGVWHKIERGEIPLDAAFYQAFKADLQHPQRWESFIRSLAKKRSIQLDTIPPVPNVDAEYMFNRMMTVSKEPDPWMWPALKKLKASGRYLIAALSNTTIWPESSVLSQPSPHDDVKGIFDVFISSAHVGLRKPDPAIYKYTLDTLDKYARENAQTERGRRLDWKDGVRAGDILFLDDIGENLKAAKQAGFGTMKVNLGRAFDAVSQLEQLTGLQLDGGHPKISSAPRVPAPKL